MQKVRKSNFELMRIISMVMIIYYHIIIHGNILINSANVYFTFVNEVVEFLIIVHVNLFMLLTGYFQINSKFKLSKVFSLLAQTIFYAIGIMVLLSSLGLVSINKIVVMREVFLLENTGQYWFIKVYLLLYCLSPFINILINKLDRNTYKKLIFSSIFLICAIPYFTGNKGFFVNNGFSLYNAIVMYLIGAYFKQYQLKDSYHFTNMSKRKYQTILLFLYFFFAFINYALYKTSTQLVLNSPIFNEIFGNFITCAFQYENPIIIVQSICLFLFFESLDIKYNKIINRIAKLIFGVYLIHENFLLQPLLYKMLKIDNGMIYSFRFILYVIFIVLFIFIIGILIELLRQKFFKFIYDRKISHKFRDCVKTYLYDFGFRINW